MSTRREALAQIAAPVLGGEIAANASSAGGAVKSLAGNTLVTGPLHLAKDHIVKANVLFGLFQDLRRSYQLIFTDASGEVVGVFFPKPSGRTWYPSMQISVEGAGDEDWRVTIELEGETTTVVIRPAQEIISIAIGPAQRRDRRLIYPLTASTTIVGPSGPVAFAQWFPIPNS